MYCDNFVAFEFMYLAIEIVDSVSEESELIRRNVQIILISWFFMAAGLVNF